MSDNIHLTQKQHKILKKHFANATDYQQSEVTETIEKLGDTQGIHL